MPLRGFLSLLAVAALALAAPLQALTIRVPSDQPTIQAGLTAAAAGDTVLVVAGTYSGPGNRDLDFGGTDCVLLAESGPDVTTIDCEQAGCGAAASRASIRRRP